jgi:hypothetical protein
MENCQPIKRLKEKKKMKKKKKKKKNKKKKMMMMMVMVKEMKTSFRPSLYLSAQPRRLFYVICRGRQEQHT